MRVSRQRPFLPLTAALAALIAALLTPLDVLGVRPQPRPPASGATASSASPLSPSAAWPPAESFLRRPEPGALPAPVERIVPSAAGLGGFAAARPAWWVGADPLTGSVGRAFGPGLSLPSGTDADLTTRVRRWIEGRPELLAPGVEAIHRVELMAGPRTVGAARWVRFTQQHAGIPVLDAGFSVAVKNDRVLFIASRSFGVVSAPTTPLLLPENALAQLVVTLDAPALENMKKAELAYAPEREGNKLRHRLVWKLMVKPFGSEVEEAHHVYVDAMDGSIVALFPDALHASACEADHRRLQGIVRGGVRPNEATDAEESRVFPDAVVSEDGVLKRADRNGHYEYDGGIVLSTLPGDTFEALCDDCNQNPLAGGDDGGLIDFGSGGASLGTPVVGNGTSTPADRSAFYHLQQAGQLLGKWNVRTFPEIRVRVNQNQFCNASSGAYRLNFFKEGNAFGNTCHNTGEVRDVMQHELGHTWDRTDGNGISNGAMSEWKGDLVALFLGGDACVGESFYISPTSTFPTTVCSGVRDIDEKSQVRQDHPATPGECANCATLTRSSNNCFGGVHCTGEIPGQAVIHLKNNLLTGTDYISGAALDPALSADQTEWLLEKLFLGGGPPMDTWDPLAPGVSVYDAVMVADDDDANLANGTPHASYINAAFQHHEIAESPLITDAAGCAEPADPTGMSATLEFEPITGRPRVRIAWSGTGTFDVLRAWRIGDAWLPLATGVAAGPVFDENVGVGETLHYVVFNVSNPGGCEMISPGTAVATVAVEPPELRLDSASTNIVDGDGDTGLEPGETAEVTVTLGEIAGFAGATNVTATLHGQDPSVSVVDGGPVSIGALAASATGVAGSPFTVKIAPDAACAGEVFLPLTISSDEGCWADGLRLTIQDQGGGACALTSGAYVRAVPGSLQVGVDGGDFDAFPDNCEQVNFSYLVENIGDVPSGPGTAAVTALSSEAPLVAGQNINFGSLLPGEQTPAYFSADVSALETGGEVLFQVAVDSAGSAGPSVTELGMQGEEDAATFATVSYDFESGTQGWLGNFDLSSARSVSGSNSLHGGSTTESWLCEQMVSPILRIGPGASALTMQVYVDIENISDTWYDRANVHILDVETGVHTLVSPTAGISYNASGGVFAQVCHVDDEGGWAGDLTPFGSTTFDLSAFAGREVRVEVNYASDGALDLEGIYVDDVSVTNAREINPDAQSNVCAAVPPEVSPAGAAVPLDVAEGAPGAIYTWEDLGPGFAYNLYAGTAGSWFSHSGNALTCGSTGVSCNGTTCTFSDPTLPAGDAYFLVTASQGTREGPSGYSSVGQLRDPLQDSCAP